MYLFTYMYTHTLLRACMHTRILDGIHCLLGQERLAQAGAWLGVCRPDSDGLADAAKSADTPVTRVLGFRV